MGFTMSVVPSFLQTSSKLCSVAEHVPVAHPVESADLPLISARTKIKDIYLITNG